MRAYGQFCPVARTAELFAERWTPIIVRNLLNGCRTFSEIRQGAPGIPTALLSQRLDTLQRAGIIERQPARSGRGASYHLTDMGRELKAVCDAMGQWGARWLEIEPHHTDPAYVLWATTKLVDVAKLPDRTVVVRFEMRDRPAESYWMVLRKPNPELCTKGSGYTEDIVVRTDSACLIDIHLKRTTYQAAVRDGRLAMAGTPQLTRAFVSWIRPSPYADVVPARP
ncbi:MAG TPA: helix-turn-helix domain-containing protein [Micromonosporaceae bacterium]|nr:helix-turn-helix domain-containing protein [Micromonosporaceae bacterium]